MPTKSSRKRRIPHAFRGSDFENLIKFVNERYAAQSKAWVIKQHVPTSGAVSERRIQGTATVDYIGCVAGGKIVAFDCKSCLDDHLPIGSIPQHQVDDLLKIHNLGGHAFILVWFRNSDRIFRVPINAVWMEFVYNKRIGMNLEYMEREAIELACWRNTIPICDYLANLRFDPGL